MFQGSMVALVTPMKEEDLSLDLEAVSALIEWHVEANTGGLVILGTTGEAPTITQEERKTLIRHVVTEVKGRLPVIVGTGSNATAATVEMTQEANDLGADACLIVTPYYNKPTQEGLYKHYRVTSEAVAIPQVVYNVPSRTGCDLLPKTLAQIAVLPNIVGIKDATGSLERLESIKEYCGGFKVFSGDDATAKDWLLKGAEGVISVTANIAPKLMRLLCQAARDGEEEQAQAINKKLESLHQALFIEPNPIPVKWALCQLGKIQLGIRPPLTWLSNESQASVDEAMADLKDSEHTHEEPEETH